MDSKVNLDARINLPFPWLDMQVWWAPPGMKPDEITGSFKFAKQRKFNPNLTRNNLLYGIIDVKFLDKSTGDNVSPKIWINNLWQCFQNLTFCHFHWQFQIIISCNQKWVSIQIWKPKMGINSNPKGRK